MTTLAQAVAEYRRAHPGLGVAEALMAVERSPQYAAIVRQHYKAEPSKARRDGFTFSDIEASRKRDRKEKRL